MQPICKEMKDTKQQFEHVIAICRDLFSKKLHDYGPAWRILRPASVTDQIFIKANRIRSIETKGVTLVDEGDVYKRQFRRFKSGMGKVSLIIRN